MRPNPPQLDAKSAKDLVSNKQLEELFGRLDRKHRTWLAVLILSGRRQGDLINMRSSGVTAQGNDCYVMLPKDKMHQNSIVAFHFSWDWSLAIDLQPIKEDFYLMVNKHDAPFSDVNIQKIKRRCDFRLHAIRNRRAIEMAVQGSTEEEIMSSIGWANKISLLRYTQVPVAVLGSFNCYDDALAFLNN